VTTCLIELQSDNLQCTIDFVDLQFDNLQCTIDFVDLQFDNFEERGERNTDRGAPLPCRGGDGGGVSIFFADRIIQTPPLTPPLEGRGAAASFAKW
jgi:hypothetical protein